MRTVFQVSRLPGLVRLAAAAAMFVALAATAADLPRVRAHADAVYYEGHLTADGLTRLQAVYAENRRDLPWLAIDSSGGEVNVAMDFGDWVFTERLNVRVVGRCFSACANYVFPAAPVKVIETGAVVAWHGSAVQSEPASRAEIDAVITRDVLPAMDEARRDGARERIMDETLAYLERARERERRFFEKIGVDERITRIGIGRPGIRDFWFLSVPAMQRFGIERVVAPSDYAATDTRRFGDGSVVYLELADDGP